MSLKAFHILFVVVSTLFAIGFALWGIHEYRVGGKVESLVLAGLSLLGAIALLIYGRWFLKKLKGVGYLVIGLGCLMESSSALACAVCFGDPESPMTKGAAAGTIVLGAFIGLVLLGVVGTGLFWVHRGRRLSRFQIRVDSESMFDGPSGGEGDDRWLTKF